jgi:hypothetical protein
MNVKSNKMAMQINPHKKAYSTEVRANRPIEDKQKVLPSILAVVLIMLKF